MSAGFGPRQLKKLATGLDPERVLTRQQDGKTLSYIEGWFAIAEANRIFGYDGWDREMVHCERVFERRTGEATSCGYAARVRIGVRAHATTVVREGTGFGQAHALRPGDAHERALKAAETDATKRALATFGGRFGLLLYDKNQKTEPVRAGRSQRGASIAAEPTTLTAKGQHPTPYRLVASDGSVTELRSAESFCAGLRQLIEAARDREEVMRLQRANQAAITALRALSHLTTQRGEHYADVLERLLAQRVLAIHSQAGEIQSVKNANSVADDWSEPFRTVSSVEGHDGLSAVAIETAVAAALPQADSERPIFYEPFVPVPAYPLAQMAARLLSTDAARSDGQGAGGELRTDALHASTMPAVEAPVTMSATQAQPVEEAATVPSAQVDEETATGTVPAVLADVAPNEPQRFAPTRRSKITSGFSIDKSALQIPSERRLRSKSHLTFVASKPCLLCEGLPCHAHHITFAQPRGLSQKVSDEFTVPLCAVHHNELHAFGNETSWWRTKGIDPLAVAGGLWRQTATGETEAATGDS